MSKNRAIKKWQFERELRNAVANVNAHLKENPEADPRTALRAGLKRAAQKSAFLERAYNFYPDSSKLSDNKNNCPDCDSPFIFSYAVIRGAYNRATEFANEYLEATAGKRSLQDMTDFGRQEYYKIGSDLNMGKDIPILKKKERDLSRDYYSFSQKFVADSQGDTISSGINKVWYDPKSELNNISDFEHIRISENQLGGNREEGKIRFRNSKGRINVNLNFQKAADARKFWEFYYTDVYNNTVKSILKKYDR